MKRPSTFFTALCIAFLCIAFISSCKKENSNGALEPISLLSPDSIVSSITAGNSLNPVVQITTDRPIDWVLCVVDVDTLINSTNYVPTYPDTFSFKVLQNLNPQVNIYKDSLGTFNVPATTPGYVVIRFKVSFLAGDASGTYGQNYPVGVVSDSKEFIVNVN